MSFLRSEVLPSVILLQLLLDLWLVTVLRGGEAGILTPDCDGLSNESEVEDRD